MHPSPYRVLFICMGNICRSPAGENIFRHLIQNAQLSAHITCDSAGTIGYHHGKAPDSRMSLTLKKRGYPISGTSRKFHPDDFDQFHLILTMDDENYANIIKLAENDTQRAKVQKFTDYCTQHPQQEVPDPYYGEGSGFELVADLIEDGATALLAHICQNRKI